jgi:hypothetical protein
MKKIVMLLICSMLMIGLASAFLPTKDTNPSTSKEENVKKYPSIEINDWFGLGKNLFKGQLEKHTDTCAVDCSSEMQLYTSGDNPLIDNIKFYTIKENERIEQPIRNYQFYIQDGVNNIEVPYYKEVCNNIINENGTTQEICNTIEFGTEKIQKPNWKPYNLGDILPSGYYYVRLEGQKKPDRAVDWIIETQGKVLDEWATWGIGVETLTQSLGSGTTDNLNNAIGNEKYSAFNFTATTSSINTIQFYIAGFVGFNQLINASIVYINSTGWINLTSVNNIFTNIISPNSTGWYNISFPSQVSINVGQAYAVMFWVNETGGGGRYFRIADQNPSGGIGWFSGNGVTLTENIKKTGVTINFWSNGTAGNLTLNAPVDYYNSSSNNIAFNATATMSTSATLVNMSLFDNSTGIWKINKTQLITGTSNTSIIYNNYSNGQTIKWAIQACDSDGACGFSGNRTFTIDSQAPSISLSYPSGIIPIAKYGQNVTLNYSISDINLQTCWYNHNVTTNVTIPCTANSSLILNYHKSIIIYTNDSLGNLNTSSFTWSYNIFENNHTFNSSALETTRQGYVINTTINTTIWIAQSATLYFDNTAYATTKTSSGDNLLFTSNIDLPAITVDTSKNILWQIQITNATGNYLFNTSTYNQTISKTVFARCGTTANVTFLNFTVYSQTDTSIKINTSFYGSFTYWGGDGRVTSTYTYQETGATNSSFPFCLEPNSSIISIDADIQYGNTGGFAQNYFYSRDKQISNNPTNVTLHLLNSSLATITTLRLIDSYQNGLIGYIGYIYKHDLGTGTDNLVGMFKTNYNGQDISYLNWYDTLYKFNINDPTDTTLIYTADPFKVSSTPQLFRVTTIDTGITWTLFKEVSYNLSVNNNTGTFLLTFSDPNNHLTAGCLRIVRFNGGNITVISDQCANGTAGTLTYTIASGINGTYYGIFYGKGSSNIVDFIIFNALDYLDDIYSQIGNLEGSVLAILVISLSAFVGIFSPVAFIVMAMVGYIVIMLLGFQSMNTGNFQIYFFTFLAIGGYLVWKLRT